MSLSEFRLLSTPMSGNRIATLRTWGGEMGG